MGSKITYKTFSMSTTVREMERVPDLMRTIIRLEKEGNNSIATKKDKELYISEIISEGFVTSNKVDELLLEKIQMNLKLTKEEVCIFMSQASQKPTWAGRLSNYFNKTESLGFSFRDNRGNVSTTKLGRLFIDFPMEVTKWSLVNIPANNPMRRIYNNFTPLGIIAEYILHTEKKEISRDVLAILLSLHDQKEVKTWDFSRKGYHVANTLSPSIKASTIKDYVDEMIRTLVFSGLFQKTFVGIKPTKDFLSNVETISKDSFQALEIFKNINNEQEMFEYLNNLEYSFEKIENIKDNNALKIKKLAKDFSFESIQRWISLIGKNEPVDIPNLNIKIKRFVVIEWLFALFFAKKEDYIVTPNLSLDYEGYPISHAGAGKPDIEIKTVDELSTAEITLLTNRVQILNNETTNLVRHAKSIGARNLYFFAPRIHEDVEAWFAYMRNVNSFNARAIDFDEVVQRFPKEGLTFLE